MAMEVFGSFESKDEAIKKVEVLSLKGIPTNKITIFTLRNPDELVRETDGIIVNEEEDYDTDFMSKVKKTVLNISDTDKSFHDQFLGAGLSEEQATRYVKEIRSGNIVVIAENKLKMGHDSTPNTDELEVPIIQRGNDL